MGAPSAILWSNGVNTFCGRHLLANQQGILQSESKLLTVRDTLGLFGEAGSNRENVCCKEHQNCSAVPRSKGGTGDYAKRLWG